MDNSRQLLEKVRRRKLFLQELDGRNNWYRYHSLFAGTLCQRLEMKNPELKEEIHRVAGKWFAENGFFKMAVEQAIEGEDYEMVTRLIFRKNDLFLRRGEKSILKQWLNKLPEDLTGARPELVLVQAMIILLEGDISFVEEKLYSVKEKMNNQKIKMNNKDKKLMQGMLAVAFAVLKLFKGDGDIKSHLEIADKLLPADFYWKLMVMVKYGDMLSFSGDIDGALNYFRKIKKETSRGQYGYFIQLAESREAYLLWFKGYLQKTAELCDNQLERAENYKLSHTPLMAALRALRGNIYCEHGDFFEARRELNQAREIVPFNSSEFFISSFIRRMWLRYCYTTGEYKKARDIIEDLNFQGSDGSEIIVNRIIARVVRFWLEPEYPGSENWRDALDLLSTHGAIPGEEFELYQVLEYLALGRVLMAGKKVPEAEKVLMKVQKCTREQGLKKFIMESGLVLARLYEGTDRREKALIQLKRVIEIAAEQGFFMLIVDEGADLVPLLDELRFSDDDISPGVEELLKRLLDKFSNNHGKDKILAESLSEREMEVLKEIAAGYSSKEIAGRLNIASGTVRWHCSNIYGKLGVGNRTGAVVKARELGLLE